MRLGFSYWGFCERHWDSSVINTPDGGRFTRPILVEELNGRVHEIICLQNQRESKPHYALQFDSGFPNINALFVEWRWPTYKNDVNHPDYIADRYEPDLDRQKELMDYYHGKIPVIVWDTDAKVTDDDLQRWPEAYYCEPCLNTSNYATSLPFFTDGRKILNQDKINRYIYVGSNYERYEQFEKYYANASETLLKNGVLTEVWGNWLQYSPERPEQREKVREYHNKCVIFHNRNPFMDGMVELSKSLMTVHITKKQYSKLALLTPRYFEAMACNTPGFTPSEVEFDGFDKIHDTKDVIDYINFFKKMRSKDPDVCKKYVENQQKKLLSTYDEFNVAWTVDKIEKLVRSGI